MLYSYSPAAKKKITRDTKKGKVPVWYISESNTSKMLAFPSYHHKLSEPPSSTGNDDHIGDVSIKKERERLFSVLTTISSTKDNLTPPPFEDCLI